MKNEMEPLSNQPRLAAQETYGKLRKLSRVNLPEFLDWLWINKDDTLPFVSFSREVGNIPTNQYSASPINFIVTTLSLPTTWALVEYEKNLINRNNFQYKTIPEAVLSPAILFIQGTTPRRPYPPCPPGLLACGTEACAYVDPVGTGTSQRFLVFKGGQEGFRRDDPVSGMEGPVYFILTLLPNRNVVYLAIEESKIEATLVTLHQKYDDAVGDGFSLVGLINQVIRYDEDLDIFATNNLEFQDDPAALLSRDRNFLVISSIVQQIS